MSYWPGTNIPKSRGNAFDWRNFKRPPIASTWNSGYRASESREKVGGTSISLRGSLENTDPRYFHVFTRA